MLAAADDLLVLARFGVGYDSVDVAACTRHDVVLTIARGAVDRSVAEVTVAWMLALSHQLKIKDRLTRELRWHDRSQFMGWEIRNRTLGIAGAGIDCFSVEPLVERHRLVEFDNVLLAPHAVAWTDELFQKIGRTACRSLVDLANGRKPHGVVNLEVFERPSFQAKWERLRLSR